MRHRLLLPAYTHLPQISAPVCSTPGHGREYTGKLEILPIQNRSEALYPQQFVADGCYFHFNAQFQPDG